MRMLSDIDHVTTASFGGPFGRQQPVLAPRRRQHRGGRWRVVLYQEHGGRGRHRSAASTGLDPVGGPGVGRRRRRCRVGRTVCAGDGAAVLQPLVLARAAHDDAEGGPATDGHHRVERRLEHIQTARRLCHAGKAGHAGGVDRQGMPPAVEGVGQRREIERLQAVPCPGRTSRSRGKPVQPPLPGSGAGRAGSPRPRSRSSPRCLPNRRGSRCRSARPGRRRPERPGPTQGRVAGRRGQGRCRRPRRSTARRGRGSPRPGGRGRRAAAPPRGRNGPAHNACGAPDACRRLVQLGGGQVVAEEVHPPASSTCPPGRSVAEAARRSIASRPVSSQRPGGRVVQLGQRAPTPRHENAPARQQRRRVSTARVAERARDRPGIEERVVELGRGELRGPDAARHQDAPISEQRGRVPPAGQTEGSGHRPQARAGIEDSADARGSGDVPSCPPATSTRPSGSSVALWSKRALASRAISVPAFVADRRGPR